MITKPSSPKRMRHGIDLKKDSTDLTVILKT
jgi:hypothetical protein